jgi:hypothetical protein
MIAKQERGSEAVARAGHPKMIAKKEGEVRQSPNPGTLR